MLDLILLARYLLVPKGRLVFFLPTVTEEYEAIDIPVVDGMRELKVGEGSVENFGKWGRRVSGALLSVTRSSSSQRMRLFRGSFLEILWTLSTLLGRWTVPKPGRDSIRADSPS
jgi:hypothetical protein